MLLASNELCGKTYAEWKRVADELIDPHRFHPATLIAVILPLASHKGMHRLSPILTLHRGQSWPLDAIGEILDVVTLTGHFLDHNVRLTMGLENVYLHSMTSF